MFKNTTLQNIAITKSFNFNKNDIIIKRSRTCYLLNVYSKQITLSKKIINKITS